MGSSPSISILNCSSRIKSEDLLDTISARAFKAIGCHCQIFHDARVGRQALKLVFLLAWHDAYLRTLVQGVCSYVYIDIRSPIWLAYHRLQLPLSEMERLERESLG